MDSAVNLMDLCDETLVHIFTFLDSTDLYHLSFVSERIGSIVRDEFLWIWCDARLMPNTKEKIKFCEENMNRKTRVVMLAGECHSEPSLSATFFPKAVTLQNLAILALENQFLDGRKIHLRHFPAQLQELSLTRSYVAGFREFFKNCSDTLKALRVLKLDRCQWFESHSLIPLSKLQSLEILSFYLCKQLTDRDMSYISLAGRLGFKILKVLDVRFTGLGDEVLKSFYKHLHLSELYFQGYAKTYQLECAKRKLELLHGSNTKFNNYRDPFLEVDDTNPYAMIDMFGQSFSLSSFNIQKVTDNGVRGYASLQRDLLTEYIPPKSVLYKRPYGRCKCGFIKSDYVEERAFYGIPYEPERNRLEKQIEALTKRSQDSVYYLEPIRNRDEEAPRDIAWLGTREPINDMEILIYEHLSARAITEQDSLSTNIIEVDFSANQIRARDSMEVIRIPRELPRHAHFFHRDAQNILRENSVRISMIGRRERGAMLIEELRSANGVAPPSPPQEIDANGGSSNAPQQVNGDAGPSGLNASSTSHGSTTNVFRPDLRYYTDELKNVIDSYRRQTRDQETNTVSPDEEMEQIASPPPAMEQITNPPPPIAIPPEPMDQIAIPPEALDQPGPSRKRKFDDVAGPSKRKCCFNETCFKKKSRPSNPCFDKSSDNKSDDENSGINSKSTISKAPESSDDDDDDELGTKPCDNCAAKQLRQKTKCSRCDKTFELYVHKHCSNVRLICPDCAKRNAPKRPHPYIVTWGEKRCVACGQYVSQMFFSSNAVVAVASSEWRCPECTQRNNDNVQPEVVLPPVQRNERQLNVHVLRIEGRDNHVPALDRIIVSQLAGQRLIGNLANSITPLRMISLRGYDKISDYSLRYLKHLNLDLIDVTYTRVTKRGVEAFLRDNPNCRIVHESACQCGPELHF